MIVAIEAYWSSRGGLDVVVVAIEDRPSWQHERYTERELARVPDADQAAALGEQLAREHGVTFYFPARARPSDETARWWHRDRAQPCIDCGMLLDQNPNVHWLGMCYACHLAREDRMPRLRVELAREVGARDYDHVRALVDDALHAAQAGRFYAGSRIAGAQLLYFLCSDADRAAEIAIAALRAADVRDVAITACVPA